MRSSCLLTLATLCSLCWFQFPSYSEVNLTLKNWKKQQERTPTVSQKYRQKLGVFKNLCFYCKGRFTECQNEREGSSTHRFTPQMAPMPGAAPLWSQEPGAFPVSHTGCRIPSPRAILHSLARPQAGTQWEVNPLDTSASRWRTSLLVNGAWPPKLAFLKSKIPCFPRVIQRPWWLTCVKKLLRMH